MVKSISTAGLMVLRGDRLVINGLDFTAQAGRAVILTGPNGAGKSTLLRVLAGLLSFDAGTVTWTFKDGEAAEAPADWAQAFHYVGHQNAVKPSLTVAENLNFWARFFGGQIQESVIRSLRLDQLLDVPGKFLSAGQTRRVALARLTLAPRPVWLLDEPTVSLDAGGVALLERMMMAHLEKGGLVLAATHIPFNLPNTVELRLGGGSEGAGGLSAGGAPAAAPEAPDAEGLS